RRHGRRRGRSARHRPRAGRGDRVGTRCGRRRDRRLTTVGSTTRIPAVEGVPGSSVVLVGLGSPDPEATDETLRRAAGAAARACRGLGTALVTLAADRPDAVALGAGLG